MTSPFADTPRLGDVPGKLIERAKEGNAKAIEICCASIASIAPSLGVLMPTHTIVVPVIGHNKIAAETTDVTTKLATAVAQRIGAEVDLSALKRHSRNEKATKSVPAAQREKHVTNSFKVNPEDLPENVDTVIVVDDISMTGWTMHDIKRAFDAARRGIRVIAVAVVQLVPNTDGSPGDTNESLQRSEDSNEFLQGLGLLEQATTLVGNSFTDWLAYQRRALGSQNPGDTRSDLAKEAGSIIQSRVDSNPPWRRYVPQYLGDDPGAIGDLLEETLGTGKLQKVVNIRKEANLTYCQQIEGIVTALRLTDAAQRERDQGSDGQVYLAVARAKTPAAFHQIIYQLQLMHNDDQTRPTTKGLITRLLRRHGRSTKLQTEEQDDDSVSSSSVDTHEDIGDDSVYPDEDSNIDEVCACVCAAYISSLSVSRLGVYTRVYVCVC